MNTLKSNLKVAYLDCVNNYTSTAGFAAAYGLTPRQAGLVIEIGREIHEAGVEKPAAKNFTVVAVSTNATSFGYKSVLCLAEDGEGFEGLVQAYGTDKVPAQGDVVTKADSRWYASVWALRATKPADAKKILKSIKG